jgi:hypothetical protein
MTPEYTIQDVANLILKLTQEVEALRAQMRQLESKIHDEARDTRMAVREIVVANTPRLPGRGESW